MNRAQGLVAFFVFFSIAVFFSIQLNKKKYQVSRYGENGAIVIDTETGEAWETGKYKVWVRDEKKTFLSPIVYCDFQKDDYKYTPNDSRNQKNIIGWWERLTNKFYRKRKDSLTDLGQDTQRADQRYD